MSDKANKTMSECSDDLRQAIKKLFFEFAEALKINILCERLKKWLTKKQ